MTTIRLNIGAGDTTIPGFIPIDQKFGHDASKLEYEDNSVDEIYSSHCLEHIHHSKTCSTIEEWCRVLKPGGRIRIAIPDFEKVIANFKSDPEKFGSSYVSAWLHGTYDEDHDRHRAVILKEELITMLRMCGIENIGPWTGEYPDHAGCNPMTLNIGGYKREIKIPREPSVVMVLSTPRFGPVDTFKSIADGCQSLGWRFFQWGGTEWGKGLESVCQQVIKEYSPDYIMTIDYDGVFSPDDCKALLDFMQNNPDVAAVWPVQAHRHQDLPLGFAPKGAAIGVYDFKGEFTRMWSGHFGCTIIRRQVFDTIPHPWFWSIPDPDTGDWSKGSDADLTFWRWMHTYGFKFGQLNTVQIGHMEWCVKWMAPRGIIWQPIQNYRAKGKPTSAVFDGEFWVQRARNNAIESGELPAPNPVKADEKPIVSTPKIENQGVNHNGKNGIKHSLNNGDVGIRV